MSENTTENLNDEQFIDIFYQIAIEDYISLQEEMFSRDDSEFTDENMKKIKDLLNRLNAFDRKIFFKALRMSAVDTASLVFGIIDGISYFREESDRFKLVQNDTNVISGNLQDFFLSKNEELK